MFVSWIPSSLTRSRKICWFSMILMRLSPGLSMVGLEGCARELLEEHNARHPTCKGLGKAALCQRVMPSELRCPPPWFELCVVARFLDLQMLLGAHAAHLHQSLRRICNGRRRGRGRCTPTVREHYARRSTDQSDQREQGFFGRKRRARRRPPPPLGSRPGRRRRPKRTGAHSIGGRVLAGSLAASLCIDFSSANRPHSSIAPNRPCHCEDIGINHFMAVALSLLLPLAFVHNGGRPNVAPSLCATTVRTPPPAVAAVPTALLSVVGIGVLTSVIVVHEAGHFLAARAQGIKVSEFSIGSPPSYLSVEAAARRAASVCVACTPAGQVCLLPRATNRTRLEELGLLEKGEDLPEEVPDTPDLLENEAMEGAGGSHRGGASRPT